MKPGKLLTSALMALGLIASVVGGIAALLGYFWLMGNYPIHTLGVTVFVVFTYLWRDAYKFLD